MWFLIKGNANHCHLTVQVMPAYTCHSSWNQLSSIMCSGLMPTCLVGNHGHQTTNWGYQEKGDNSPPNKAKNWALLVWFLWTFSVCSLKLCLLSKPAVRDCWITKLVHMLMDKHKLKPLSGEVWNAQPTQILLQFEWDALYHGNGTLHSSGQSRADFKKSVSVDVCSFLQTGYSINLAVNEDISEDIFGSQYLECFQNILWFLPAFFSICQSAIGASVSAVSHSGSGALLQWTRVWALPWDPQWHPELTRIWWQHSAGFRQMGHAGADA